MVKITVYMPAYNYAQYIEKAVKSVLSQTMSDWELIIINDGSTDNTREMLRQFKGHPRITILHQENKGLNATNNIALRLSSGQYIMRLDADDYLDENALLILSRALDNNPDIGLVYPDYYEIDPQGEITNLIRRKKIGEEVEILDLPAHGACTMFRKECLLQIGGYLEEFTCQDGYEIWLRLITKYKPFNINIPLFYYRQHSESLTKMNQRILDTRRQIKRRFVEKNLEGELPKVLGLVPVLGSSIYRHANPFQELAGKPLIFHTLNEAKKSRLLDRIVVASDDVEVLEYVRQFEGVFPISRPASLSDSRTEMSRIVDFVLEHLERNDAYLPDVVCTLYINTPLRNWRHIDKAIDTLTIFGVDSVVSVVEELFKCYQHRRFGLVPIEKSNGIRLEKNAIYKENSAVYVSRTEVFKTSRMVGEKVGHITMLPEESIKINSEYDLWLAEKVMTDWKKAVARTCSNE